MVERLVVQLGGSSFHLIVAKPYTLEALVEGLEAIAEVGHSVVQQDVDPVALRLAVGVPFSCDDSLGATVGCG